MGSAPVLSRDTRTRVSGPLSLQRPTSGTRFCAPWWQQPNRELLPETSTEDTESHLTGTDDVYAPTYALHDAEGTRRSARYKVFPCL